MSFRSSDLLFCLPRAGLTCVPPPRVIIPINVAVTLTSICFNLKVSFCRFPSSLLCGELQKVKVELLNLGEGPLHKLHLASTNPNLFALDVANSNNEDIKIPDFQRKLLSRSLKRVAKISLTDECLNARDKIEYIMWVQGRRKSGISNEELLFYYESTDENPSMR